MAGSVTMTETRRQGLSKIKFAWTSDSAGAADATTTYTYNAQIWQIVTIPGTSTSAPTTLYDITLKDGDGVDLANGLLADRSATANEVRFKGDGLLSVQSSAITLAVTNAGDTKSGTVIVHYLPLDA